MTAGQNLGMHDLDRFVITSEFLNANNCFDPYPISPSDNGPVLFRDNNEIVAMNENS
jgi:hypothetical protein